jgi:hypothetical protein
MKDVGTTPVLFSNEALFYLVNTQNSRYLSAENPLHDVIVGAWCAVSATRIVGPILSWDSKFTAICYTRSDNTLITCPTTRKTYIFFYKDSETVHAVNNPMRYFKSGFSDRIKSSWLCFHVRQIRTRGMYFFVCAMSEDKAHIISHWTRS